MTRVRNGAFNRALGFRELFVGIAFTAPSIDRFRNYIFKLMHKILTAFTMNILFLAFFYLSLFSCYLILKKGDTFLGHLVHVLLIDFLLVLGSKSLQ